MDYFLIKGGNRLSGDVLVTGAKNAALGIIPGAILAGKPIVIDNIPDIRDVHRLVGILKKMGVEISLENGTMHIDSSKEIKWDCTEHAVEMGQMRASYYLLGALLGRYHKACVPLPGGCNIGDRPIDQHIKGFEALGAKVVIEYGVVKMEAEHLCGANIYLDVVSVGATINIMLAACMAEGTTVIENVAKEPHVVDVANFLNLMGANIKGAGTDVIKIQGVSFLRSCEYTVVPDQITAGTYMMMAAATRGDILVRGAIPKHMEAISAKLREMGVTVLIESRGIRVIGTEKMRAVKVKTQPYPGFPTDLQQPMAVLMALAEGQSEINENIFESRFRYVDELRRMGAKIRVNGNIALINGVDRLTATRIKATDLRAGAAMVLAALVAEGETRVTGLNYIDRGYEKLEENIRMLGGEITRIHRDHDEE